MNWKVLGNYELQVQLGFGYQESTPYVSDFICKWDRVSVFFTDSQLISEASSTETAKINVSLEVILINYFQVTFLNQWWQLKFTFDIISK